MPAGLFAHVQAIASQPVMFQRAGQLTISTERWLMLL